MNAQKGISTHCATPTMVELDVKIAGNDPLEFKITLDADEIEERFFLVSNFVFSQSFVLHYRPRTYPCHSTHSIKDVRVLVEKGLIQNGRQGNFKMICNGKESLNFDFFSHARRAFSN